MTGGRGPVETQFEKKILLRHKIKGEGGLAKLEMSHLSYLIISKNIYQIFMKNFHKFCLKNVISRGGPLNFLDKTDSNG